MNTVYHSRRRAEISTSSPTALAVEGQRAQRVGDRVDALALERVARASARRAASGAMKRRSSSISPASRKAPARCGPPSSRIEVTAVQGAELVERRAHARGLVLAGGDDDLGAGRLERVGRRAPRGARDDDDRAGPRGAAATSLRVERQARRGVEDDAPRLAAHAVDARGQLRVVGQRGADADGDGVARRRASGGRRARLSSPEIHLRVAGLGRDLAVERHRRLEEHPRAAGARVLAEGLVEQARARGQLAVGDVDLDALVAQDAQAAARGLLGRVVGGDDDAADAGREDRVGARRRAGPGGSTARARRRASRRAGRRRRRRRSR